jgi:coatomer protein complex subunit gamma
MSFTALERSIKAFNAHPLSADQILSLSTLPRIEDTATPVAFPTSKTSKKSIPSSSAASQNQAASTPEVIDPAACIYNIPEFSRFGRAFKSCAETPLTETEMEYVVHCSKHIFDSHVILQFSVLNTIDDQRLKDVCVQIDISEPSYTVQSIVTAPVAKYGEKVNCFVCIAREDPIPATINCQLQFKVIQVDPQTGEVEGDEAGYEEDEEDQEKLCIICDDNEVISSSFNYLTLKANHLYPSCHHSCHFCIQCIQRITGS